MTVQIYEKDFPIYTLAFMRKNKYWISKFDGYGGMSPYYAEDKKTGSVLWNCVPTTYGYWACLGQITDPYGLDLSPYNANSFYDHKDNYERSRWTCRRGAIACWSGGAGGYGHVAIVTNHVDMYKDMETINAGGGAEYYTRTYSYPYDFNGYKFQGFIECPFIVPDPPKPEVDYKYKIGDAVLIHGDLYKSSMADSPAGYIVDKVTKITRLAKGSRHPYNTTGDLGWMDEKDIKPYETEVIKVGDKVEPIRDISYSGNRVVRWDDYYYITELVGERAVLAAKRGSRLVTWCAMNVNNLRKV